MSWRSGDSEGEELFRIKCAFACSVRDVLQGAAEDQSIALNTGNSLGLIGEEAQLMEIYELK